MLGITYSIRDWASAFEGSLARTSLAKSRASACIPRRGQIWAMALNVVCGRAFCTRIASLIFRARLRSRKRQATRRKTVKWLSERLSIWGLARRKASKASTDGLGAPNWAAQT